MSAARITIYNIDYSLQNQKQLKMASLPLLIPPIHTIENAHYSSIIDLEYLKISQLIVSSSTDGTIKFWDPIARPKKLTHGDGLALMKPGYYKKLP